MARHPYLLSKQTGFYAQLIDYIIRLLLPSPTVDQHNENQDIS